MTTTGDGVLATFPSASGALFAGAAIRDALAGHDLQVRVGVHVEDVDQRGLDISGIAVNVASRVMTVARPGQILAAGVRDDASMSWFVRVGVAWAANVLALLISEAVDTGVTIEPEWRVLTAGIAFGLVNWAVRPILKKLAAPLIIVTLGIALFFVNLLGVYLASEISTGFTIDDFDATITVAFFLWIANALVQAAFAFARRRDEDRAGNGRVVRRS